MRLSAKRSVRSSDTGRAALAGRSRRTRPCGVRFGVTVRRARLFSEGRGGDLCSKTHDGFTELVEWPGDAPAPADVAAAAAR